MSVYIQQVAGVKDGHAAATFFPLERERGGGQEGNACGYIHCPTMRHERRHKDTVKGTVGSTRHIWYLCVKDSKRWLSPYQNS